MQELQELWQKVIIKMQNLVSTLTYDLYISKIEPIELNDNKLLIFTPTSGIKNHILKNHSNHISECIQEIFGDNITFELLEPNEKEAYLSQNKKNIEDNIVNNSNKQQFNEKYTFDNFVVGKSNQVCYAAAHAIAENPGKKFNPLFIYSGVGLGKTHLMHAIGNYLTKHNPNLKIKYITCENFMNEYIESLGVRESEKNKSVVEFREKYRNVDVLMVDDIQLIANRNATKEEFFHTFNDLYQNNKQIILTSDRSPQEIDIEDRLKSRFACGLLQDMQIPDFETRLAILKKKTQLEKYYIDDETLNLIAEKPFTNIREMEGILSKVFFFATLMGKKTATKEDLKEVFKDDIITPSQDEKLTPELIIKKVCDYYNVTEKEIIGKKKTKEIVEPRQIAIYLIDDMLDIPLVTIGKLFGGRDHTTCGYARDKITEQIKKNNKIASIINDLKSKITNQP